MAITVRHDGILFNDGTLQTSASASAGPATTTTAGLVHIMGAWGDGVGQYNDAVASTRMISHTVEGGPGGKFQNWQNVTASRAVGVTYRNWSHRGIVVSVTSNKSTGLDQNNVVNGFVNGALLQSNGGFIVYSSRINQADVAICFIVPPLSTYRVDAPLGLARWSELS